MKELHLPGMTLRIYGDGPGYRPAVWVHSHAPEELASRIASDCAVIAVETDAPVDLTPWPAPGLFPGEDDFTGGADGHIAALEATVPAAEAAMEGGVTARYVAGYSLGGLFAVYVLYRSPIFAGAACVSGSLWYDGWEAYAETHPFAAEDPRIYLSVGSREHRTRNRRMAAMKSAAQSLTEVWSARCPVVSEVRPGGHFDDPTGWLARGIDALVEMGEKPRI